MTHNNHNYEILDEGITAKIPTGNAVRYGVALPFAATVTVALTLSMATLIRAEFTPQDKAESASFEINPRVEDIRNPDRVEQPDPLKKVETPPPPPRLETVQTAAVDSPIIEMLGKKTVFEMKKIDIETDVNIRVDTPPTPHVRIPPVFPTRFLQGDVSGYCRVTFDISADGLPFNVKTTRCTNAQLASPTVKSVQKWKYAPEIRGGQPVSRSGLETTIRFDLKDERGNVLPVPSGF